MIDIDRLEAILAEYELVVDTLRIYRDSADTYTIEYEIEGGSDHGKDDR